MLLYSNQQVPLQYITIMSSVRVFLLCFVRPLCLSDTQLLFACGIRNSLSVKGTIRINYFHFSCAGGESQQLHAVVQSLMRSVCIKFSLPVVVPAVLKHKISFCLLVLYLTTSRGKASLAEDAFVSDYNHDL